ncbi:MAG: hypothetical protein ACRDLN_12425, partial [Solirubrobacteraceae bacterium]
VLARGRGADAGDDGRFEATQALRRAALNPESPGAIDRAVAALRRTAHLEVDSRPRHAAVALSACDAIECTEDPFASDERREVFWEASRLLLKQLITTDQEMSLLDMMEAAGLERVPPFERSFAGQRLAQLSAEDVR